MQPLPVTLRATGGESRMHVGKFPEGLSLADWEGMRVARCVDARAEALVAAPLPEALGDGEAAKREAGLAELARSEMLWASGAGDIALVGRPLPNAGHFVALTKDRDGKGYSLTVVREWFEFSQKRGFRPMNIEEAEAHLKELQRKSVMQATSLNRKMATDKLAADAAVMDVKRAMANKEAEDGEARLAQGAPDRGEDADDNIDYEFECSDDDESAAVMVLATEENVALKKHEGGGGAQEDASLVNPLERVAMTQEERLEKRLAKLQREAEESERRERAREDAQEAAQEAAAASGKRMRPEEQEAEAAAAAAAAAAAKKQKRAAAAVMRPLTEEEIASVLRDDPNVTLQKLIGLFKTSLGSDPDKKSKFNKLVAKMAVIKTVDGQKVLRLRQ